MLRTVHNNADRVDNATDGSVCDHDGLSDVVSRLEHLVDRLGNVDSESAFDWARPASSENRPSDEVRAPLPHPQLVRSIIRQRQLRQRFFDGELFSDPAWDILLDLTAAKAEWIRVSITSLCIASGVPASTALRWINQLTEAGLIERVEDPLDRRRTFIQLTDRATNAMSRYFQKLSAQAALLV